MFQQHLQGQDQEFVVPPQPRYEFRSTSQAKIKVQTLVIALFGPSSLFALSLVQSKSPTARVNFLKSKQTSLADIYVTEKTSTGYLIFNNEVEKMKEVYFSEFVNQAFEFERVLILAHQYINNLENASIVCLKHMKTSTWKGEAYSNQYEQGLMGLAADILVWGQINRVPVCAFVGLFNDYELTKETIRQVFGGLVGKQGMNEVSQIGDKIKKYNMKKYSNHLYL